MFLQNVLDSMAAIERECGTASQSLTVLQRRTLQSLIRCGERFLVTITSYLNRKTEIYLFEAWLLDR